MIETASLKAAITEAVCAPSIHNSQPWRWRITSDQIELYADLTRHLPWTDPDRRDLLLSCGAALHHLRLALAAQGFGSTIRRLDDPDNEWHLATIVIRPGEADPSDTTLEPAISRRRTDRRRMSHRPVPESLVTELAELVHGEGASVVAVTDPDTRCRLETIISDAAREQAEAPGYSAELQMWTHRYAQSADGISASHLPQPLFGDRTRTPLRAFPKGALVQPRLRPGSGDDDDAAELFAIVTAKDDYLAWLRAGEALSALLLGATLRGLATTPLSQAVEIADTRDRLRRDVLDDDAHPQILVRVGWPATSAADLPKTPRRDVSRVLTQSE